MSRSKDCCGVGKGSRARWLQTPWPLCLEVYYTKVLRSRFSALLCESRNVTSTWQTTKGKDWGTLIDLRDVCYWLLPSEYRWQKMKVAPGAQSCRCTTWTWVDSSRGRKGVPFAGIQFVKGNCTFWETIYPDLEISGCLSNTWIPWGSRTVLISIHGHLHGWKMQTVTWASHLACLS